MTPRLDFARVSTRKIGKLGPERIGKSGLSPTVWAIPSFAARNGVIYNEWIKRLQFIFRIGVPD
jgi:hypothetical protein